MTGPNVCAENFATAEVLGGILDEAIYKDRHPDPGVKARLTRGGI